MRAAPSLWVRGRPPLRVTKPLGQGMGPLSGFARSEPRCLCGSEMGVSLQSERTSDCFRSSGLRETKSRKRIGYLWVAEPIAAMARACQAQQARLRVRCFRRRSPLSAYPVLFSHGWPRFLDSQGSVSDLFKTGPHPSFYLQQHAEQTRTFDRLCGVIDISLCQWRISDHGPAH